MKNDVFKALFINVIVLLLSLICFEFTLRGDDWGMALALYGVYGTMKPYYFIYGNALYGDLLLFLIKNFPSVPWYTVLFVFLIFLSFSTITYIFLKKESGFASKFCIGLCLFFGSILFYKNLDFTMITGLLITAGLVYLLYLIQNDEKFYKYLWGIFLIFIALLLRNAMLNLILGMFVTSFLIVLFSKEKRQKKTKKILLFIGLCVFFEIANWGLIKYNNHIYSQENVADFQEINSKRSLLFDWNGFPDYDTYQSEYQKLGVSKTDYTMWAKQHMFSDLEATDNMNLFEKICQIAPVTKGNVSLGETIDDALHKTHSYISHTYTIFLFICGVGLLLILRGRNGTFTVCSEMFLCLAAYLYMSYLGRVKRYVNEPMLFAASVLLLYYCDDKQIPKEKKKYLTACIFFIVFIFWGVNHNNIATSSYLGFDFQPAFIASYKEQRDKTFETVKLIADDGEHLYFYHPHDAEIVGVAGAFSTFQRPPYGFGKNMYFPGDVILIYQQPVLENFGIKTGNPFGAMTNNEDIFWYSSDQYNDAVPLVCDYIRQRYCPDVEYQLVKRVEDIYVYRFYAGEISLPRQETDVVCGENIVSDVTITVGEENDCLIAGYAYVEGEDSFAQNIYISATDKITGRKTYYYALQEENSALYDKDKYSGKYSQFSANIELPNTINNVSIAIYIDSGGKLQKVNCAI